MEVLQTVVEQKSVDFPFVDRVTTAFDAVFVHQYDHIAQIVREHVRLVPGSHGIEQHKFSIRNHARRIDIFREQPIEPISF